MRTIRATYNKGEKAAMILIRLSSHSCIKIFGKEVWAGMEGEAKVLEGRNGIQSDWALKEVPIEDMFSTRGSV